MATGPAACQAKRLTAPRRATLAMRGRRTFSQAASALPGSAGDAATKPARVAASSIAIAAPCAANGVIACAASPIRAMPAGVVHGCRLVDRMDRPCGPRAGILGKPGQRCRRATHGAGEDTGVGAARPALGDDLAPGEGGQVERRAVADRIGDEVEAGMQEGGHAIGGADRRKGFSCDTVCTDRSAPGKFARKPAFGRKPAESPDRRPDAVGADQQKAAGFDCLAGDLDCCRGMARSCGDAADARAGGETDVRQFGKARQQRALADRRDERRDRAPASAFRRLRRAAPAPARAACAASRSTTASGRTAAGAAGRARRAGEGCASRWVRAGCRRRPPRGAARVRRPAPESRASERPVPRSVRRCRRRR